MFRRAFLVPTAERAVKAFAATLASLFLIGGEALDIRGIDWGNALGVAAGAALASVLFSIGSYQIGPKGSPSLVADPAAAEPTDDPGAAAERLADRKRKARADLDPGPAPGVHRVRRPGDD